MLQIIRRMIAPCKTFDNSSVGGVLRLCVYAVMAVLSSLPAIADGVTRSTSKVTASVVDSITISSGLGDIPLTVDFHDGAITSSDGSFTVKANSVGTIYDVWVTVPNGYVDVQNAVYLAKSGNWSLPLRATLSGNTGANAVQTNPAETNSRPIFGNKSNGRAVAGSNANVGTLYTVKLSEVTDLFAIYNNIPSGTYSLTVTAHIALAN